MPGRTIWTTRGASRSNRWRPSAASKPKQSLETFRRLRAENYDLLKGLPESAFDRTGNHSQNGIVTLRQMLDGFAGHAESHARQLQEIREEYKKVKGKK
ncbi:hypothetical protein SBA3_1350015 [Candidatus Sulfopaludibacter sp. SbA3]|nr:hypothetical protein SBA3_1350015 [Candidatus Sulfopaludibacter sp. SbA3]